MVQFVERSGFFEELEDNPELCKDSLRSYAGCVPLDEMSPRQCQNNECVSAIQEVDKAEVVRCKSCHSGNYLQRPFPSHQGHKEE